MSQKDEEDITRQAPEEEHCQEASLPYYPEQEASQKIEAYHIEQYVGQTSVDKHIAHNGPGLF